eukprot:COSAG06_NODE_3502_length_5253_cov_2.040109_2_plen_47_part_00
MSKRAFSAGRDEGGKYVDDDMVRTKEQEALQPCHPPCDATRRALGT